MSKEIPDEIEFLKASAKGEIAAFETIVKKYQSFICAITFSATGDVEKSEELAQEAFISAWKDLAQLKDLTKFRSWIGSIARNVIRNSFRSQERDLIGKSASMDQIEDVGTKDSGPVEEAITRERQAVVRQAIQQIPEKYREPLVLFYRQQQSVKDVAEQLQLSEAVVRQRLSRARKLLREQVAAMVETTISRTGPKKAFTTAVIASVTGMVVKGSAVAAAGIVAVSETPTAAGLTTVMSGITAKIIAAAAVVAIGVGAVVTYKYMTKPKQGPELSQAPIIIRQQEERQSGPMEKATEQSGDETTSLSAVDETADNLKSEISVVVPPRPVLDKKTEFKFAPKGVLSGLITDANTGKPIKDVGVRIICYEHEREQLQTETDANGMYFFESIKNDGAYTIKLETNHYITTEEWKRPREYVQLAKNAQFVKHFQLPKGCKVNIKVVNEQGNPIQGADFYAAYVSDDMGRGPKRSIRSDKTGNVTIGGLKPAEYMITAWHRDYALGGEKVVFKEACQIKSIVFEMKNGFPIEGKAVCSDGLPASGWEVLAEPIWWHSVRHKLSEWIDENGVFVLPHITAGVHKVSISIPSGDVSLGLWSTDINLPPENGFLELSIPKPSPHIRVGISGKIKFVGGEPSRGVWVRARSSTGNFGSVYLSKGETDFTIDNLVPDLYTIDFDVMSDDAEDKVFKNVKVPSGDLVFEIPIKKKGVLRGKVVDKETGDPIPKFKVRVVGERDWQEIINDEGKFDIKTIGENCQNLQIKADGFALKTSQEICPDVNETAVIELGIGGAIEGTVVDENWKPIKDARISYRYKRSRDEKPDEKYITATDANGMFVIEGVPEDTSSQWFVITHPNYAPEIKMIEVEDNYITDVEIVLKEGGTIEGYVYDSKGRPIGDTTLYFMDESHYPYWKENRARLGSVTTDSNGYYKIKNMPEKLCFGFRQEPDKQLGVVCTVVLPRNGKTARLDFGGLWYATGRLLQDGKPMSNVRILLQGNTAGYETTFTAYALTDSDGRFTFWGIPSGLRFIYWSIPGMYGWGQWIEIGRFDFESGVDLNLGDLEASLSEVSVKIVPENPTERLDQLDVFVQRYSEKQFWGTKAGQILPREDINEPYTFSKLSPGTYEIIANRQNYPTIRKVFEIEQGQKTQSIDLQIPASSASLSGKIIPYDPGKPQSLLLRSADQTVTMDIRPDSDGSYEVNNLPFGDYIIGKASVALSRHSTLKEVSLAANEHKNLNIEIPDFEKSQDGYLVVLVVTEGGLPLAGTDVWLERAGETIVPHFDGDKSKSLKGEPGEWILHARFPGYKSVRQKVTMKSKKEYNTQEILKPVVIIMSK